MKPPTFASPHSAMQRAIEIARRGIGYVEPNPPVGAVIVASDLTLIAEGFHTAFGQPHAEPEALTLAGEFARGATLFVTLEPCQHHGKTPPCTQAIIDAGLRKVVVGSFDPAKHTSGKGIAQLQSAGIDVEVGMMQSETDALIAPFKTLHEQGRPWVHAKWAMTLDGKTAAHTGHSQWISSPQSRAIVHELRGRMDAIIVGSGTVAADDPQLTARPAGARTPVRVVMDSSASLPLNSNLVRTAAEVPVIVYCGEAASVDAVAALRSAGVEVVQLPALQSGLDVSRVLKDLGGRQFTHVLLEGGGTLAGSFLEADVIDEVHAFIAPKVVGGQTAQTPIGGTGRPSIDGCPSLVSPTVDVVGGDVYVHGVVDRHSPGS